MSMGRDDPAEAELLSGLSNTSDEVVLLIEGDVPALALFLDFSSRVVTVVCERLGTLAARFSVLRGPSLPLMGR